MRKIILFLFLFPATLFAQIDISTLNKDYTEALVFANQVRRYYGYSELKHDDKLAKDAKATAKAYLVNQKEVVGEKTIVYLVNKHQFSLIDNYIVDATVGWIADTNLITRRETFEQITKYGVTKIGFAIVEKNNFICVAAKFDN